MKAFREEVTKTLSNVQTKISMNNSSGSRSIQPSYEWIDETKRLGNNSITMCLKY